MSARDKSRNGSLFAEKPGETPAAVADELYDDPLRQNFKALDAQRHIADLISINVLRADLRQPRHTMPNAVRANWDGSAGQVRALLETWHGMAEEEIGGPIPLQGYLEDLIGFERAQTEHEQEQCPIWSSYMELIGLAADIRRLGGLTNDITIVRRGEESLIETGERRWLSYHLLYNHFADEKWSRIPARVEKTFSRRRQASENGARAGLSAIARARQLALLIMEELGESRFQPYEALVQDGGSDRAYYAQVGSGEELPLPAGVYEAIMDAMGIKGRSQVRQYRALLNVSDDLWEYADDCKLTEGAIRTLAKQRRGAGVTVVTQIKPSTIRVPTGTAERLKGYRESFGVAKDGQVIERLIAFYEEHRGDI